MPTSPSRRTIEAEAESLEAARMQVKAQIPSGLAALSERILSDGEPKTAQGVGDTVEGAYEKAKKEVPTGAVVMEKKVLVSPKREVVPVEAFDEDGARADAAGKAERSSIINAVKLVRAGKRGFLGLGKRPNRYEVEILHRAVVHITHKARARVRVEVGKSRASAAANEHYLLKCRTCGFSHPIPPDVRGPQVEFSVDPDEVKITCVYGSVFTVSLEVREFFEIIPTPVLGHPLQASIGPNILALHSHMLTHCDPLFLIIQQSRNQTLHGYRNRAEGQSFVKYSGKHGVDIVGNIDVSKAEIPGLSK